MRIEFLWFDGCPSHQAARELLEGVLIAKKVHVQVEEINATQPEVAEEHRFPGSPTIRIDGHDIEPGFIDPGDYTPRCRLYFTPSGLRGIPERTWLERAIEASLPA